MTGLGIRPASVVAQGRDLDLLAVVAKPARARARAPPVIAGSNSCTVMYIVSAPIVPLLCNSS